MPSSPDRTQITRALLRLRELIFSGEFRPGERLSELPLVELEHEGLLLRRPGGGYVVREFTLQDIADAIELRGVLEGTAARFAAERGVSARTLRALRSINDAIEQLVHRHDYASFARYVDLNQRFHARLLRAAGSEVLERALEGILSLPFAGPNAFVLAEAELPQSRTILVIAHRHHAGMIEALADRQGARAESLAREHARIALTNLEIVLEHRDVLARLPGASLLVMPPVGEAQPAAGCAPEGDSARPVASAEATGAAPAA